MKCIGFFHNRKIDVTVEERSSCWIITGKMKGKIFDMRNDLFERGCWDFLACRFEAKELYLYLKFGQFSPWCSYGSHSYKKVCIRSSWSFLSVNKIWIVYFWQNFVITDGRHLPLMTSSPLKIPKIGPPSNFLPHFEIVYNTDYFYPKQPVSGLRHTRLVICH